MSKSWHSHQNSMSGNIMWERIQKSNHDVIIWNGAQRHTLPHTCWGASLPLHLFRDLFRLQTKFCVRDIPSFLTGLLRVSLVCIADRWPRGREMKNADPKGFCVLEVFRSRVQNINTMLFTLGAVNYHVVTGWFGLFGVVRRTARTPKRKSSNILQILLTDTSMKTRGLKGIFKRTSNFLLQN